MTIIAGVKGKRGKFKESSGSLLLFRKEMNRVIFVRCKRSIMYVSSHQTATIDFL
jgi:hypothetical protein